MLIKELTHETRLLIGDLGCAVSSKGLSRRFITAWYYPTSSYGRRIKIDDGVKLD